MYRNLKAEIARTGMTTCECAEAAGVSLGTFYRLLNGSSEWRLDEMLRLSQAIAMKNGHAGLDYLFARDYLFAKGDEDSGEADTKQTAS